METTPFLLTTSVREAAQALREGRLVSALESPGGAWSEVRAIEALREHGVLTPAYRIRFANGHLRVTEGAERFRLSDD